MEASRVARRVGEAAGSDGGERCLDIQQAFPDFVFPLGDFAQPGLHVGANLVVTRFYGVLAGFPKGARVAAQHEGPPRPRLAGDGGVAERLSLKGRGRVVRPRRGHAGEVGVGEAGCGAVLLPARLDPGALAPRRCLRQRRRILLRRRLRQRGSQARGEHRQNERLGGRNRGREGRLRS